MSENDNSYNLLYDDDVDNESDQDLSGGDQNDLIKKAKNIIPTGEYNDVLEQLGELYKNGQDFDNDIIDKLQEYNPFLFQVDQNCVDNECVITQIYPQLLQYSFRQKTNIYNLQKLQYKIILYNTLFNIKGEGKYFQENINIPETAPVPDRNEEMFVYCQPQQWETKIINQNQKQIKIALYYDDYHILLCDDIIDNPDKLKQTNVIFAEDVLQFNRKLLRVNQIPIQINVLQNSKQDENYLMNLYNIPQELQQALLQQALKQNSTTIISSVGEALKFQDKIQKNKNEE